MTENTIQKCRDVAKNRKDWKRVTQQMEWEFVERLNKLGKENRVAS